MKANDANIENYMVLAEMATAHVDWAARKGEACEGEYGDGVPLMSTRMAMYEGSGGVSLSQAQYAAYAATQHRLYALPIVCARVEDIREELREIENLGMEALKHNSMSIVRMIRPGTRLDPEEVHATQVSMLRARLAADERELRKMRMALECVSHDRYFPIIELRYFKGKSEQDISWRLNCDASTVSRNRRRLVKMISLRLYGV